MEIPNWQYSPCFSVCQTISSPQDVYNSSPSFDEKEFKFTFLTNSFSPISLLSPPRSEDEGGIEVKVEIVDESNSSFSVISSLSRFEEDLVKVKSEEVESKMSYHYPHQHNPTNSSNYDSDQQPQQQQDFVQRTTPLNTLKRSESDLGDFHHHESGNQQFFVQGDSHPFKRHQTGQDSQTRTSSFQFPSQIQSSSSLNNLLSSSNFLANLEQQQNADHSRAGAQQQHQLPQFHQSSFSIASNSSSSSNAQDFTRNVSQNCVCGHIPCTCSSPNPNPVYWGSSTKSTVKSSSNPIPSFHDYTFSSPFSIQQQPIQADALQQLTGSQVQPQQQVQEKGSGSTTSTFGSSVGWKPEPFSFSAHNAGSSLTRRQQEKSSSPSTVKPTFAPSGLASSQHGFWLSDSFSPSSSSTGMANQNQMAFLHQQYSSPSPVQTTNSNLLMMARPVSQPKVRSDITGNELFNSKTTFAHSISGSHSNFEGLPNASQSGYLNFNQTLPNIPSTSSFTDLIENRPKETFWFPSASSSNLNANPAQSSRSEDTNLRESSSQEYSSEESRWNAIVQRSHAADAYFVYGSHSTKIYCRPSCASKRPDREKVHYFSFPNAGIKAESLGFRACKRCKPGTQATADICVLAVGECLRHMTRAALLGESDKVDQRMKRKTLKQYAMDFGLSAFHFHRTLKNVSTLTPGEYSKACQSLVLQDEIGIDRYGVPLRAEELNQKLAGWSSRRARKALGNMTPHSYANGMKDVNVYYIVVEKSAFGCVVVLHTLNGENVIHQREGQSSTSRITLQHDSEQSEQASVLSVLIGEDSVQRALIRCPNAIRDEKRSAWLQTIISDLARKGTREVQIPTEILPWLRRARVYLAVKYALEPFQQQEEQEEEMMFGSGKGRKRAKEEEAYELDDEM